MNHPPVPIKPGTTRRLGLRPPKPRFLIQLPPPITDEQCAEFKAAFEHAQNEGRWQVLRADDPRPAPADQRWLEVEAEARRWWQRLWRWR